MFKYIYENSKLTGIKFSVWYLLDTSMLFCIFYCFPILLPIFYGFYDKNFPLFIFVLAELMFLFISIFVIILHVNIFKFKIEIYDEEISFKCLKKSVCFLKSDIRVFGIIRRTGTALSVNPYSENTVYISSVEIQEAKLYKSLWQKHMFGCGTIGEKIFLFPVI